MTTNTPSLSRWSRLVDGDQPWGSLQVTSDRFGLTAFRLTVYPPGLNSTERRKLRLWRGWPMWGSALWFFSEIALIQVTGPWRAIAISTVACLGTGALARHLAGPTRAQVRIRKAALLRGHHDPQSRAVATETGSLARSLADADDRFAQGDMTAVEYEMTWWHVYQRMAASTPTLERKAS